MALGRTLGIRKRFLSLGAVREGPERVRLNFKGLSNLETVGQMTRSLSSKVPGASLLGDNFANC